MTNGNDQDPTRGLPGVRAADGGDPGIAPQENAAEETTEVFCCPYCRRAYTLGQIHAEIYSIKESSSADDWLARQIEEGLTGGEETDGPTPEDAA